MSTPGNRVRVRVRVRSGKRSLEEAVPQTARVVEVNVHRRSRQAKAAVGEQRAIARVLVDSPAAHLRGDRRGLVQKRSRGKPHEKMSRPGRQRRRVVKEVRGAKRQIEVESDIRSHFYKVNF